MSEAGLSLAFGLNLAFALIEVAGGIWTNSLSILSDSLHDLGDSFAIGLSWYLETRSKRGKDRKYSYGYRRFSLLAGLVNAVLLTGGSLWVLSKAIPRLVNPAHPNAPGMVGLAIIGVVVNGTAALRLRSGKGFNARIVAWHLIEDVLGWAAVLAVSIVLLFRDIHILDPLLSTAITAYVLYNVVGNLRKTMAVFLQGVPANVDVEEIEARLSSIDGVRSTHHTHVWSLDGERHVLTSHLVVDRQATRDDLVRIKSQVAQRTGDLALEHATIELEYEDEDCWMRKG